MRARVYRIRAQYLTTKDRSAAAAAVFDLVAAEWRYDSRDLTQGDASAFERDVTTILRELNILKSPKSRRAGGKKAYPAVLKVIRRRFHAAAREQKLKCNQVEANELERQAAVLEGSRQQAADVELSSFNDEVAPRHGLPETPGLTQGEFLEQQRLARGWTLRKLTDFSGLSGKTVQKAMQGRYIYPLSLHKLIDALNAKPHGKPIQMRDVPKTARPARKKRPTRPPAKTH